MSTNRHTIDHGATIEVVGTCERNGTRYSVIVDKEKYARWEAGEYVQIVFPELSLEQREFLITGITPAEWDALFPHQISG